MKEFKVGLQLYAVREDMKKDPEATLKAIKEMGYDYVELAGLFDREATELKCLMDKYGIKAISAHEGYPKILDESERILNEAEIFGYKYCAIAWMGKEYHKGSDKYAETLENFKKIGNMLGKKGAEFLYHNHDFEFARKDGKFIHQWIMEDAKDWVNPEIDVCWVHFAGYKPEEYILQFKGRLPLIHLKDFACTKLPEGSIYTDEIADEPKYEQTAAGFEPRPVGYGVQNVEAILKACGECGTEYLIVEDEASAESAISPLEAVKMSREYLKKLGV